MPRREVIADRDDMVLLPDARTRAAQLAWSEDDDEEDELGDDDESGLWLEALGGAAVPLFVIAVTALVVAVGGWFWIGQRHQSEDIAPPSAITTSVPAAGRTSTVNPVSPPTSPNPANTAANAGR